MVDFVYNIPYRRARAWPLGRVRARAKESCIQWLIGLLLNDIQALYTRYPIVARALGRVRRASKGILHTNTSNAVAFSSSNPYQYL